MKTLTVTEDIKQQLAGAGEVALCDESGRTLGHFLEPALYERLVYDWANAQISDEELERRRQEPGGRSLKEIWQRLESR